MNGTFHPLRDQRDLDSIGCSPELRIVCVNNSAPEADGGPPRVLRMNNGAELVSQALQRFCDGEVGWGYVHLVSKELSAACGRRRRLAVGRNGRREVRAGE